MHRGPTGVEHRVALGDPIDVGVQAGRPQPLVVGHHDREAARDHRRDEQLFVVERQIQPRRPVDALVELTRRRALVTLALSAGAVHDQRPRPLTGPVVVRLEVGARHRHRVSPSVGAAVHDSRARRHDRAQLTRRLEHQPRRLGADHIAWRTRRQRIRRRVELGVLVFVEVRVVPVNGGVGGCLRRDSECAKQRMYDDEERPTSPRTTPGP